MNLYLAAYNTKFELLYTRKWLDTNSLREINVFIHNNPINEKFLPLLASNEFDVLRCSGKTPLLFANEYYFLHDLNNSANSGLLRDITIDDILND